MQQLQPCINETTVLLPLLNGVNSRERIKAIYPNNLVLDGCVYIVSHILAPGVVENKGNIQTLYFGLDNYSSDQLVHFEQLFHQAGIEATLSKDISTIIWEKFIFLSPIATATSYYNKSIGEIISTKESLDTTIALIKEVEKIAIAKKIKISENTIEKTLHKYQSLPFESTSSMHNDFKNKKINTELSTLTGYVIFEGKKYAVATPTYSKLHAILEKKRNL
jgi:2-dehydropantoate 2-reductase